jgi:DNA repair photolyase
MISVQKIARKSLLYKSRVDFADFCVNHVEGCSHGCKYPCYAMLMKKRCGVISSYEDWCRPKIVDNALELLEREIPKYQGKMKSVHLCFSTDPFMYKYDEIGELSLRIMRRLNRANIPCTTLTKGIYPGEIASDKGLMKNEFGITLVSLDEGFRRAFEPNTARFDLRIQSLRHLHERGFKTWVSIEPYPTPNIIRQDLITILRAVSFVNKIVFGRLNYSRLAGAFQYARTFYNDQARAVKDFCKENNILCHIKEGTETY